MTTTFRFASLFIMLAAFPGSAGCRSGDQPDLGLVSGTVTLDGKPLPGVIIVFKPDQGRPATATTDVNGKYDLVYRYGVNGAKLGNNTVSFEWPIDEGGAAIPEKYGVKSELKQEVKAGKNTFDFNLESQ